MRKILAVAAVTLASFSIPNVAGAQTFRPHPNQRGNHGWGNVACNPRAWNAAWYHQRCAPRLFHWA